MRIILLRHGESVDDILNCYGGAADYELTENGKNTAKEVAEYLANTKIDKIYSSPLKRAFQTAITVDEFQKCGVKIAHELYERNSYGVLSGTNKDDCKEVFGYILEKLHCKVGDYYSEELVLGAESLSDFDKRVKNGLDKVVLDALNNNYESIAIVIHGNVTRSIYKNILKVSGKLDLELLAISYLKYENGDYVLIDKKGIVVK